MNILTIDSGTTNTRVIVWRDGAACHVEAREVGVRDTAITGSKDYLRNGVCDTVGAALRNTTLQPEDIGLILASGMITSNVGLHEVKHVLAPASLDDIAGAMVRAEIDGICGDLPVWFVPGVRNPVDNIGLHNIESLDMMRGEEVEAIGLAQRLGLTEAALIVLPGSHSKFVHLDERQRITGCVTTLAGELLQIITSNTILANSLDSSFAVSIHAEMLLAGARHAAEVGLGRACFMVRTLDLFSIYERNARANFLLGAILGADLLTLKNSDAIRMNPSTQIVVAGKSVLRDAFQTLLDADDFFSGAITAVGDEQQQHLAGFGAITAARRRGLLPPYQ
jgi:2-dehydro-3-deoxygalactonokinase